MGTTTTAAQQRSFRLAGSFSLACLVGVLAVAVLLTLVYRHRVLDMLVRHEEGANVNLAHALANAALPGYRERLGEGLPADAQALRSHAATAYLRERLSLLTRDLHVSKVKVYDAHGLAVFSTDESQIGEDKSGNAGFLAAMQGRVTSQLTHRDRFDAIEGVINDRSLVSSYVPTSSHGDERIDGVFEIYVDVTHELVAAQRGMWSAIAAVLLCLGALYAWLLALILRADRLLQAHDAERNEAEARIRHMAFHDPLTGLPNRAAFGLALEQAVQATATRGHRGALLYIDLNRFKQVNDQLGHAVGDALLCALATRLQRALGPGDALFRIGGDEFTVLLAEEAVVPDPAASRAARVAGALIERCAQPINALEHLLHCSISIGVARLPEDGRSAEQLLLRADMAMYAAKAQGAGALQFFDERLLGRTIRSTKEAAAASAADAIALR